jgi:hypothetical protein
MSTSVFVYASLVVMTDGIAAQAAWLLHHGIVLKRLGNLLPPRLGGRHRLHLAFQLGHFRFQGGYALFEL